MDVARRHAPSGFGIAFRKLDVAEHAVFDEPFDGLRIEAHDLRRLLDREPHETCPDARAGQHGDNKVGGACDPVPGRRIDDLEPLRREEIGSDVEIGEPKPCFLQQQQPFVGAQRGGGQIAGERGAAFLFVDERMSLLQRQRPAVQSEARE
jgi:hypothetical protein